MTACTRLLAIHVSPMILQRNFHPLLHFCTRLLQTAQLGANRHRILVLKKRKTHWNWLTWFAADEIEETCRFDNILIPVERDVTSQHDTKKLLKIDGTASSYSLCFLTIRSSTCLSCCVRVRVSHFMYGEITAISERHRKQRDTATMRR